MSFNLFFPEFVNALSVRRKENRCAIIEIDSHRAVGQRVAHAVLITVVHPRDDENFRVREFRIGDYIAFVRSDSLIKYMIVILTRISENLSFLSSLKCKGKIMRSTIKAMKLKT